LHAAYVLVWLGLVLVVAGTIRRSSSALACWLLAAEFVAIAVLASLAGGIRRVVRIARGGDT
jgi:hypothetical protein